MNELLVVLILLTEILMILQCLQIVFAQKLSFDRYVVGILLFDFAIYIGINAKKIPMVCSCFFYLLTYLFCLAKFGKNKWATFVRMMIAFFMAGCMEGIMILVTNPFKNEHNEQLLLFLSGVVSLIVVCIVNKEKKLDLKQRVFGENKCFIVVVGMGILFAGVLADYYINYSYVNLYVVILFVIVFLLFVYLYFLEQARSEAARRKYEMELQAMYGDTYDNLLMEVRKRQHDFNNQLSAILGMQYALDSQNDLYNMQLKYMEELQERNKSDRILTGCENPILSGYLYCKYSEWEKADIEVAYTIFVQQATCKFTLHELIEVMGILLDNACESVMERAKNEKKIRIELRESEESVYFSVANPCDYITFEQMEHFFTLGYSTKGQGRGLGLTRVKELSQRYYADLQVKKYVMDACNWIAFSIVIPK